MAIDAYLRYIIELHAVCVRNESIAAVTDSFGTTVSRYFRAADVPAAQLRASVSGLPSLNESPYWDGGEPPIPGVATGREAQATHAVPIVGRGACWDGRPVYVRADSGPGDTVCLTVQVPPIAALAPELPLRTLAVALRCHEHLVPPSSAKAVLLSELSLARVRSPLEHLKRAMSSKLYASQCIRLFRAGNCGPPAAR
jgi:hypothetical protein